MNDQTLVHMANQIARAFAAEPEPVACTADHIHKFWDPRMRRGIEALAMAGAPSLSPVAREAVLRLAAADAPH